MEPRVPSRFDGHVVALAAVLLAVAVIRLRLLSVPFERDEGEYAYMGNLLLHGGLPYRDAYNMKLPGTYAMYSLIIAVFGSSPSGVHAGFALVSLATIAVLYAALRRLFTPMIGLVAATVYALLSISRPFLGSSAHATHFVNLFVVLGVFAYSRSGGASSGSATRSQPWLHAGLTGLAFGLAFVMKQPAVVFLVFGAAIVVARVAGAKPLQWKAIATTTLGYAAGGVVPYAVVVVVMAAAGALGRFWFWTVTYARNYATVDTPWEVIRVLLGLSLGRMFSEYPIVWLLAFAGVAVVWFARYDFRQKLFATLLAVFSIAAVLPGFNFREHYFVVLLPALGLLTAISLDALARLIPAARTSATVRALPFVAVVAMGLVVIANDRAYYVDGSGDDVSRMMYGGNPFVEAKEVGARIAADTTATDTVAIVGSEPEMLVYSGRRSATGYMYVYPLVEPHPDNVRMQHEMIAEIEAAQPRYLVYCSVPTSWAATPESPTDIVHWFNRYAREHYDVVGLINVASPAGPSASFWDADVRGHAPGPNSVWVLRRKGA